MEDGANKHLGELLLEEGLVNASDIDGAFSQQKRIGEILVSQGKLSNDQIDEALNRQKNQAQSTIRVETTKLDQLRHLVGEVVVAQLHLLQLSGQVQGNAAHELRSVIARLETCTRSLQKEILDVRMVPIGPTYHRYQRVVRDLALSLEKKIDLIVIGEETKLDKTVLEKMGDPLLHLVRNAVDHGVETTEKRLRAGKPEIGKVYLKAEQKGSKVILRIEDDGGGLNPEKIKKKAIEKGLLAPDKADSLTERQVFDFIFAPGFSTAEKVTDVSGRGVGMDVVRTNIQALSGSVEIDSELGKGTCVTITLPMALALSDLQPRGMLFEAGGQTFVIPVEQILEVVKVPWEDIHATPNGLLFYLRGEVVPVSRVDQLLCLQESPKTSEEAVIVVIRGLGQKLALIVDRTLRDQEIVIKPLHLALQNLPGLAGATILGDGQALLILNSDKLMGLVSRRAE
ncbi:MAG TPA: hypothetical protein DD435_09415 [Cyanobacteria bacterium UBA8530]|nr:hypothetical protein [Cyanobacteria bacterium UBA8530]